MMTMDTPKYDVFISYSRKDKKVAKRICQAFDNVGIEYFIDLGMSGASEFPSVLAQAIKNSRVFLFLASLNSYDSPYTQNEVVYAFNHKKKYNIVLYPYIIDNSSLPDNYQLTFASTNWRKMDEHPIDTILIPELQKLLSGVPVSYSYPKQITQKTEKKWLLIVVVVLVLFLIGYGLFSYGDKKQYAESESVDSTMYIHTVVDTMFDNSVWGAYYYSGPIDENGLPHGKGEAVTESFTYSGPFVHGVAEGDSAILKRKDGYLFEGRFVNNKIKYGKATWPEGPVRSFVGSFTDEEVPDLDKGKCYDDKGNQIH